MNVDYLLSLLLCVFPFILLPEVATYVDISCNEVKSVNLSTVRM